jgi:hypothetical protein
MKIDVDPKSLPGLLAFLGQKPDCVWSLTDDGKLEVAIIGSYADGGEAELERRLAAWRAGDTEESRVTELGRVRSALRARALSPLRTRRR